MSAEEPNEPMPNLIGDTNVGGEMQPIEGNYEFEGNTYQNERFVSPYREFTEYFVQFRADEVVSLFDTLSIDVDIDEHDFFRSILPELKEDFRTEMSYGLIVACLLLNNTHVTGGMIASATKRYRNKITINLKFPVTTIMSELSASDFEGEIVTFEAKVNSWAKIRSITKQAEYKCPECDHIVGNEFKKKFNKLCGKCKVPYVFYRSVEATDTRRVVFREIMSDFSTGRLPFSITGDIYGKTVWELSLSDRVIVTGVFRSIPLKNEDGKITQEFIPTIQVISAQAQRKFVNEMPDDVLIQKFKDLEQSGKLITSLTEGFAYNVYGKNMEKKAILCSLIGSTWVGKGTQSGIPPMIHILFVGDPDTYKSTIMKYIVNVFDNCVLADANTVSNAGVTAIAVKMEDGRMSIMAGLLPTHNGGVIFLDEFGDLKDDIYPDLKIPMINGTVSKHVAGEDFQGLAETGLLASMNPTETVYNESKTIYDNLSKLDKAMITRFDLIFKFSKTSPDYDSVEIRKRFAQCDLYGKPTDLLTDREIKLFINYVRENFNPILTQEAIEHADRFFSELEKKSGGKLGLETRTENAVKKLAIALARWHMCHKVTTIHIDEALEMFKMAQFTIGFDVDKGEILNEQTLHKSKDVKREAVRTTYEIMKDNGGWVIQDDMVKRILDTNIFFKKADILQELSMLTMEGKITVQGECIKIEWR